MRYKQCSNVLWHLYQNVTNVTNVTHSRVNQSALDAPGYRGYPKCFLFFMVGLQIRFVRTHNEALSIRIWEL